MHDIVDGGVNVEFCFRFAKEANMAKDMETGEPCEAYAKIKMNLKKAPFEEEYDSMHQSLRRSLANWLDIPEEHVVPISFREYVENAWEEDLQSIDFGSTTPRLKAGAWDDDTRGNR